MSPFRRPLNPFPRKRESIPGIGIGLGGRGIVPGFNRDGWVGVPFNNKGDGGDPHSQKADGQRGDDSEHQRQRREVSAQRDDCDGDGGEGEGEFKSHERDGPDGGDFGHERARPFGGQKNGGKSGDGGLRPVGEVESGSGAESVPAFINPDPSRKRADEPDPAGENGGGKKSKPKRPNHHAPNYTPSPRQINRPSQFFFIN